MDGWLWRSAATACWGEGQAQRWLREGKRQILGKSVRSMRLIFIDEVEQSHKKQGFLPLLV
jgi:hypothetical protein